jgi:hypothetical protein
MCAIVSEQREKVDGVPKANRSQGIMTAKPSELPKGLEIQILAMKNSKRDDQYRGSNNPFD